MRKTILFFILMVALLYFGKVNLLEFNETLNGVYTVYSKENIGDEVFSIKGIGLYEGQKTDVINANIEAETITIKGNFDDFKRILKTLSVIYYKEEKIDDIYIIYGYSPRLKRTMIANGFLQNVQITLSEDTITISNPINLGSF